MAKSQGKSEKNKKPERLIHVIRLGIELHPGNRELFEKRFAIMNRIHNTMVDVSRKHLRMLDRDELYQELLPQYKKLRQIKKPTKAQTEEIQTLAEQLEEIRASYYLTNNSLQHWILPMSHKFSHHVSSEQVQKEATRVYAGIAEVIFHGAEDIAFKNRNQQRTICGKSPKNGIILYDRFHRNYLPKRDLKKISEDPELCDEDMFRWIDQYFYLNIDYDDPYIVEALNADVAYCEIERLAFNDGWHYYLNVYLKGPAPKKHTMGNSTAGIDPGTSTMAMVSDTAIMLRELAPDVAKYEKEIAKLQREVDRSERISDPQNFDTKGKIKKGKHKWHRSKTCRKNRQRIRTLYRKKSAYVRQSHEILANEMLADSDMFIVEDMDYRALARRSKKKPKRKTIPAIVTKKDGTKQKIYMFERKKRFGHSIQCRAPSEFLTILQRKCKQYGGTYHEIDTVEFRASQYNHDMNEYIKVGLSCREKVIAGQTVQRDLYSAFLIRCSNSNYNRPDRAMCMKKFDSFIVHINEEINYMKSNRISMKRCFGF